MMTKDEAIESLEKATQTCDNIGEQRALDQLLRLAIAEQEQPKVRTGNCLLVGVCASEGHKVAPQREWVGLADEEGDDLSREMVKGNKSVNWLSYSIESKLKEKNT